MLTFWPRSRPIHSCQVVETSSDATKIGTIVVYLNDFLCIGTEAIGCRKNVSMTERFLESLGFLINSRKSCFKPATRCEFLGFIINTFSYVLELPPEKRNVLLENVMGIFRKRSCSILWFCQVNR